MKKAIMIALALLISAAFITAVFAQTKPEAPPEKPAKAEKAKKAKAMKATGDFVSMDAAAKTIIVKGDKGDMTFDVSAVKKVPEFKAGDKVRVSYIEKDGKMVAKYVKPAKAQRDRKEKPKKDDKPAEPAKK